MTRASPEQCSARECGGYLVSQAVAGLCRQGWDSKSRANSAHVPSPEPTTHSRATVPSHSQPCGGGGTGPYAMVPCRQARRTPLGSGGTPASPPSAPPARHGRQSTGAKPHHRPLCRHTRALRTGTSGSGTGLRFRAQALSTFPGVRRPGPRLQGQGLSKRTLGCLDGLFRLLVTCDALDVWLHSLAAFVLVAPMPRQSLTPPLRCMSSPLTPSTAPLLSPSGLPSRPAVAPMGTLTLQRLRRAIRVIIMEQGQRYPLRTVLLNGERLSRHFCPV